jgi:hypothetical protein
MRYIVITILIVFILFYNIGYAQDKGTITIKKIDSTQFVSDLLIGKWTTSTTIRSIQGITRVFIDTMTYFSDHSYLKKLEKRSLGDTNNVYYETSFWFLDYKNKIIQYTSCKDSVTSNGGKICYTNAKPCRNKKYELITKDTIVIIYKSNFSNTLDRTHFYYKIK